MRIISKNNKAPRPRPRRLRGRGRGLCVGLPVLASMAVVSWFVFQWVYLVPRWNKADAVSSVMVSTAKESSSRRSSRTLAFLHMYVKTKYKVQH
jgi:hypothetical protein